MKLKAIRRLPQKISNPKSITGEAHTITSRDADIHGSYATIYLKELPYPGSGNTEDTVAISGMTQVSGNPSGATEFHCDYETGIIYFDISLDGTDITVNYQGLGSSVDWEELYHQYDHKVSYINNALDSTIPGFTYDYEARKFIDLYEVADPDVAEVSATEFNTGNIINVFTDRNDLTTGRTTGDSCNFDKCIFIGEEFNTNIEINCDTTFNDCTFYGNFRFKISQDATITFNAIKADTIIILLKSGVSALVLTSLSFTGSCSINVLDIDISFQTPSHTNQTFNREILDLYIGDSTFNNLGTNLKINYLNVRAYNIHFGEGLQIKNGEIKAAYIDWDTASNAYAKLDSWDILYRDDTYAPTEILKITDSSESTLHIDELNWQPYSGTIDLTNFNDLSCFFKHTSATDVREFSFRIGSMINNPTGAFLTNATVQTNGFDIFNSTVSEYYDTNIYINVAVDEDNPTSSIMANDSIKKYGANIIHAVNMTKCTLEVPTALYYSKTSDAESRKYCKVFEFTDAIKSNFNNDNLLFIGSTTTGSDYDINFQFIGENAAPSGFSDIPTGSNNNLYCGEITSVNSGSAPVLNVKWPSYLSAAVGTKMSSCNIELGSIDCSSASEVNLDLMGVIYSTYKWGAIVGDPINILSKYNIYNVIEGDTTISTGSTSVLLTVDCTYNKYLDLNIDQIIFTATSDNIIFHGCTWETSPDVAALVSSDVRYSEAVNIGPGAQSAGSGADHTALTLLDGGTYKRGGHSYLAQKYNVGADPTINNDSADTAGEGISFDLGAIWINSNDDKVFVCSDNSVGAANWVEITAFVSSHTDLSNINGGTYEMGGHTGMIQKFIKTTTPTVNDDGVGTGGNTPATVGSIWLNTATGSEGIWVCNDNSTGAADWLLIAGVSGVSTIKDSFVAGDWTNSGSIDYYEVIHTLDSQDVKVTVWQDIGAGDYEQVFVTTKTTDTSTVRLEVIAGSGFDGFILIDPDIKDIGALLAIDKIVEGDSKLEMIDTGTDGSLTATYDGVDSYKQAADYTLFGAHTNRDYDTGTESFKNFIDHARSSLVLAEVDDTTFDEANIPSYNINVGKVFLPEGDNTKGDYSLCIGNNIYNHNDYNRLSGNDSRSYGTHNDILGDANISIGNHNTLRGDNNLIAGSSNVFEVATISDLDVLILNQSGDYTTIFPDTTVVTIVDISASENIVKRTVTGASTYSAATNKTTITLDSDLPIAFNGISTAYIATHPSVINTTNSYVITSNSIMGSPTQFLAVGENFREITTVQNSILFGKANDVTSTYYSLIGGLNSIFSSNYYGVYTGEDLYLHQVKYSFVGGYDSVAADNDYIIKNGNAVDLYNSDSSITSGTSSNIMNSNNSIVLVESSDINMDYVLDFSYNLTDQKYEVTGDYLNLLTDSTTYTFIFNKKIKGTSYSNTFASQITGVALSGGNTQFTIDGLTYQGELNDGKMIVDTAITSTAHNNIVGDTITGIYSNSCVVGSNITSASTNSALFGDTQSSYDTHSIYAGKNHTTAKISVTPVSDATSFEVALKYYPYIIGASDIIVEIGSPYNTRISTTTPSVALNVAKDAVEISSFGFTLLTGITYTFYFVVSEYNNVTGLANEIRSSNYNLITGNANYVTSTDYSLISGRENGASNTNYGLISGYQCFLGNSYTLAIGNGAHAIGQASSAINEAVSGGISSAAFNQAVTGHKKNIDELDFNNNYLYIDGIYTNIYKDGGVPINIYIVYTNADSEYFIITATPSAVDTATTRTRFTLTVADMNKLRCASGTPLGYIVAAENLGNYCVAYGKSNVQVLGTYSLGGGEEIYSLGNFNTLTGSGNKDFLDDNTFTYIGNYSAIFGQDNVSYDNHNLVSGQNNTNSGSHNIIGGYNNSVTGNYSLISGSDHTMSSDYSGTIGSNNTTSADYSLTVGYYSEATSLAPGSAIFGGNGKARFAGSIVQSAGALTSTTITGETQSASMVLRKAFTTTAGTTSNYQYLQASISSTDQTIIPISEDDIISFEVDIMLKIINTTADPDEYVGSGKYKLNCIAYNNAGTITLDQTTMATQEISAFERTNNLSGVNVDLIIEKIEGALDGVQIKAKVYHATLDLKTIAIAKVTTLEINDDTNWS